MESFREFVTEDHKPHTVTKTLVLTASPDLLLRLENFLAYLSWCGSVGHSADVMFSIDGDGADTLSVAGLPRWKNKKYLHAQLKRVENPA